MFFNTQTGSSYEDRAQQQQLEKIETVCIEWGKENKTYNVADECERKKKIKNSSSKEKEKIVKNKM